MLGAGWNVVLAGRRELPLVLSAAEHPNALVVPTDITDPKAVEQLFDAGIDRFGKIDVLFNNAGVFGPAATIGELTAAAVARGLRRQPQWRHVLRRSRIQAHAGIPAADASSTTDRSVPRCHARLPLPTR